MVKITFTVIGTSKSSQSGGFLFPVSIVIEDKAIPELCYWSCESVRTAIVLKASVIFQTEQIFRDVYFDLSQVMLKDLKSRYRNIKILS